MEDRLRNDLETVGRNVRLLRAARGYTQDELASLARTGREYIWSVEHGSRKTEPKLHTLARLAQALDVSLAQLFVPIEVPRANDAAPMD